MSYILVQLSKSGDDVVIRYYKCYLEDFYANLNEFDKVKYAYTLRKND